MAARPACEHEIKKALRKALFEYQLHSDTDLCEQTYRSIRERHEAVRHPAKRYRR